MLSQILSYFSKNGNVILLLCCIVPIIIIIFETRRQYKIGKVFNFRKEIKRADTQKQQQNLNKEDRNALTLIGTTNNKKPIYIQDNCKNIFIVGTTGSGKTVALSNLIKSAVEKNYPLLIIDGKGDVTENSILDILYRLAPLKKKYIINLSDPLHSDKYNPFANSSSTVIKDMLINLTDWTEPHYKANTERYLQRVITLLSKYNVKLSFSTILKSIPTEKFIASSAELSKLGVITKEEHAENLELAKQSGEIAQSATARFSTIFESDLKPIFGNEGIDIFTALEEKAIILFVLNPLLYPETSPAVGRLALIDSKKAVSKMFNESQRKFFLFDEISTYASNSLLDLVNKCRSANVTCTLATQSLSDLDAVTDNFKQQIIENCNNYIFLRQNSAPNAEMLASIVGTKPTMQVTYQLQSQTAFGSSETGLGSARRNREYIYHPDEIKTLKTGEAIFLSKDTNFHSRININKPF